jgi:DNA ligase-1
MFFSHISILCKALEAENSRLLKKKILHNFFISHTPSDIKLAIYFLSLSIENNNAIFQINEITLIKYIAEYLNMDLEKVKNDIKMKGDVGLFFSNLKEITNNTYHQIPLKKINELLIDLQNSKGKESQTEKKNKLFYIFDILNSVDICYIIRFLTGSLRIGLSERTIIEVLHEILLLNNHTIHKNILFTSYAVCSNIGYIAEKILNNEIEELLLIQPIVGNFIQPQAAEVYIKEKKLLNIREKKYITQPKLDGFRLQIHLNKNCVKLFSRNGILVNDMFPEIIDATKRYAEENNIINAIFDGEIIGFDLEKNEYLSFEQIAQRKRKYNITNNDNLCKTRFVLFDLLFYNNKNYLDTIYKDRLSIIKELKNNNEIVTIESNTITNEEEIEIAYEKAIREKKEGIMIKDLSSIYEPGKRTRTWLKYKEIQKNSLEDLIDVVVLGFTIAKGNRKNRQNIGSLLVGLYNEKDDRFETLAQVGTGGNTAMWQELEEMIHPLITKELLSNIIINKKHTPDYYISPHIIVSLKADKITKSKDHTSGYSIRFPRIIAIRKDKNRYQTHCLSLYNSNK